MYLASGWTFRIESFLAQDRAETSAGPDQRIAKRRGAAITLDANVLTIGFALRATAYKPVGLLSGGRS